ncbi:hypothetical protein HYV79_05420 [Candidatus Woesearchaeota archaeon]|nr:hypothetical protein [Candidatus Woesearchaeota archaeon]
MKLITIIFTLSIVLFILGFIIADNYQNKDDKIITFSENVCEKVLGCPEGTQFVGSEISDVYHKCSCSSALRIKNENIVCFIDEESAIEQGYRSSKVC